MNPYAARRLFDELTNAEIAYRLEGVPVAHYCRMRSNQHIGIVRTELLKVAALGADAHRFMDFFLAEFEGLYEDPKKAAQD